MPLKHKTRRMSKHKRKTVKRGGGMFDWMSSKTTSSGQSNTSSMFSWPFGSTPAPAVPASTTAPAAPTAPEVQAQEPIQAQEPSQNPSGGSKKCSKKYKSRKSGKSNK